MKPDIRTYRSLAPWTYLVAAACLLFMMLGPLTDRAHAQDKGPSKSDVREAQKAFDRGTTFYVNKEYAKAINEFRKGYELAPSAILLYNISLCYLKLEDYENARIYSRRSANSEELPPNIRTKAAARIAAISARQTAGGRAEAWAPPQDSSDSQALIGGPSTPEQTEEPRMGTLGYVGIGVAAAGAGLLVTSGILASDVDQRLADIEQLEARADYDQRREELEQRQQLGRISLYAGAGLAAAGTGLLVWDLLSDEPAKSAIIVTPQPQGAVAQIMWRW